MTEGRGEVMRQGNAKINLIQKWQFYQREKSLLLIIFDTLVNAMPR